MRFLVIVEHVNLALSRNRKEEIYGLFAGSDTNISDAKSTFIGSISVPISESGKINIGNIKYLLKEIFSLNFIDINSGSSQSTINREYATTSRNTYALAGHRWCSTSDSRKSINYHAQRGWFNGDRSSNPFKRFEGDSTNCFPHFTDKFTHEYDRRTYIRESVIYYWRYHHPAMINLIQKWIHTIKAYKHQ